MITQPIAEELLRKQYGFRLPDYRRSSLFTHLTRIKYRRRSAHSFAGQLGCCGVVLAALQEFRPQRNSWPTAACSRTSSSRSRAALLVSAYGSLCYHSVCDPLAKHFPKSVVIERIEELADIHLYYLLDRFIHDLLQMRCSAW